MNAVGIDVALPVYWRAPGSFDRPTLRFSRAGLEPMVTALRSLDGRGVKLGLFYDTTTVNSRIRGDLPPDQGADLTTEQGQDLFCGTIMEFFEALPKDLWARVDGRPLVVLYAAAFASKWDDSLGDILRERFRTRFQGESPYLVADASWGDVGHDSTTSWGAALAGPKLFPGVAQIGPGCDNTPVPGRTTPIRDREDGNFYRHSWRSAIMHKPRLVLIETWNEMHEGTEICSTIETGSKYTALTAEWIPKLKRGDAPVPEIRLKYEQPRKRL